MNLEVGQKVKVRTYGGFDSPIYVVLEIMDGWLKLKHPDVAGYFGTKIESVTEVYLGEEKDGEWHPFI